MTDTQQRYQTRMRKVLDYIDLHLDGCLDLDTLSGVAAFSKYHFHRQFMATFSLSLNRYVQLARLKRASYKLAFREHETITQIAMDAGYAAPDAFARVFRQRLGQPPSNFRNSPDWQRWNTTFTPLHAARNRLMPTPYQPSDVRIRTDPYGSRGPRRRHGTPRQSLDDRCDSPTLHCLAAKGRPDPLDQPDVQCLSYRPAHHAAGTLSPGFMCGNGPTHRA